MPQQPIVYKWTDTDAPVLPNDVNINAIGPALINLLKKCLVEGYGSKEPAGWSIEMEGTQSAGYPALILKPNWSRGVPVYYYFMVADFENIWPGLAMTAFYEYDISDSSNMDVGADNTTGWIVRDSDQYYLTTNDLSWLGIATQFDRECNRYDPNPWIVIANDLFCYVLFPYQYSDSYPLLMMNMFGEGKKASPDNFGIILGGFSDNVSYDGDFITYSIGGYTVKVHQWDIGQVSVSDDFIVSGSYYYRRPLSVHSYDGYVRRKGLDPFCPPWSAMQAAFTVYPLGVGVHTGWLFLPGAFFTGWSVVHYAYYRNKELGTPIQGSDLVTVHNAWFWEDTWASMHGFLCPITRNHTVLITDDARFWP